MAPDMQYGLRQHVPNTAPEGQDEAPERAEPIAVPAEGVAAFMRTFGIS